MRETQREALAGISQGHRIAFIRRFRGIKRREIGAALGYKGEQMYKWIAKYENLIAEPKDERLDVLAKLLDVSVDAIRKYNFKNPSDLTYALLWAEELCPNFTLKMTKLAVPMNETQLCLELFYEEWQEQKAKYKSGEMTHDEYLEWKLHLKDL